MAPPPLRLCLLLVLAACARSDDDAPADTDTDTDGPVAPRLDPTGATLITAFAYDPGEGDAAPQAVSWTLGGRTSPPTLLVQVFDDVDGQLTNDEECFIALEGSEPWPAADWTQGADDVLFGVSASGLSVASDDCAEALDPQLWADLAARLGERAWEVGVTADIDADYRLQLAATRPELPLDALVGGVYAGDLGALRSEDGVLRGVVTAAWQVDETFTVRAGDDGRPIRMTAAEMVDDGALQRGYYNVQLVIDPVTLSAL